MLVCNVSVRPLRRAIAADLAEATAAADSPGTGNVVFATLVDDPANVQDVVDAYLGQIMLEAASAASSQDGSVNITTEAAQFLARTSGLDTAHTNAYTALIDGLVADGIWSKLDLLHIYATQDSTNALLNLISSSFTGITHGSPTFTADRGFTGVSGSSTVYIDTQFNPNSGTRKYTLDS